jgi:hypothetical protein
LAFPFETIYPAESRQDVMARALRFLDSCALVRSAYLPLISNGQH